MGRGLGRDWQSGSPGCQWLVTKADKWIRREIQDPEVIMIEVNLRH